jgi:hypothetical protein
MRTIAGFLLVFAAASAHAATPSECTLTPAPEWKGVWADQHFLDALRVTREWSAALLRVNDQTAVLYVETDNAYFNLAWHEGDSGGHCLRFDGKNLWVRPVLGEKGWIGPYVKTSAENAREDTVALLKDIFTGCFKSERNERWCLSPKAFSVNGRSFPVDVQMDLSEGPNYGTAFVGSGMTKLRFLVFVARPDGWAVFEDDWASAEGRVPVDPTTTKPWRRLKK